jgi:hypothetical protein
MQGWKPIMMACGISHQKETSQFSSSFVASNFISVDHCRGCVGSQFSLCREPIWISTICLKSQSFSLYIEGIILDMVCELRTKQYQKLGENAENLH